MRPQILTAGKSFKTFYFKTEMSLSEKPKKPNSKGGEGYNFCIQDHLIGAHMLYCIYITNLNFVKQVVATFQHSSLNLIVSLQLLII